MNTYTDDDTKPKELRGILKNKGQVRDQQAMDYESRYFDGRPVIYIEDGDSFTVAEVRYNPCAVDAVRS